MGYSLLENANRFMGKSVYEQEELEAKAKLDETDDEEIGSDDIGDEDETMPLDNGEEGDEDSDLEDIESEEGDEEGDEEGEEEDEVPLMPVEAAIRAIQMALNGEVESAEEALNLVQDMEDESSEDDELEGDELQDDELDGDDSEDLDDSDVVDEGLGAHTVEERFDDLERGDIVVDDLEGEEWEVLDKAKTLDMAYKATRMKGEFNDSRIRGQLPKYGEYPGELADEYAGLVVVRLVKDKNIIDLFPFIDKDKKGSHPGVYVDSVELEVDEGCDKVIESELDDESEGEKAFWDKKMKEKTKLPKGMKELGAEDDEDDDEDEKMYGESHSKFLRLSARYL